MKVSIKVVDACVQLCNLVLESCFALTARIVYTFATSSVCTITINIHVGILSAISLAVDEDCASNVTVVGKSGVAGLAIYESSSKPIGTFPSL